MKFWLVQTESSKVAYVKPQSNDKKHLINARGTNLKSCNVRQSRRIWFFLSIFIFCLIEGIKGFTFHLYVKHFTAAGGFGNGGLSPIKTYTQEMRK